MLKRIQTEPALVSGLIQAALALAIAFGLKLTDVQTASILALTAAGLAFVVRSKVSPVDGDPAGENGAAVPWFTVFVGIIALVALLSWLGVHGHIG